MTTVRFYVSRKEDWCGEDHDHEFDGFVDELTDATLQADGIDRADVASCWAQCPLQGNDQVMMWACLPPPDIDQGLEGYGDAIILSTRIPPLADEDCKTIEFAPEELTEDGWPVFNVNYCYNLGFYEAHVGRTMLFRTDDSGSAFDGFPRDELPPDYSECATEVAEERLMFMDRVNLPTKWIQLSYEEEFGSIIDPHSWIWDWDWNRRKNLIRFRFAVNKRRRAETLRKRAAGKRRNLAARSNPGGNQGRRARHDDDDAVFALD